jgi:hypothetical protein
MKIIIFHVQIRKDRACEQIDKLLLKNVIDKFVEIDMGDIKRFDDTANDNGKFNMQTIFMSLMPPMVS